MARPVRREPEKLSGVWDYLKENIDYPYYYVKNKLAAAEGARLEDVKRGEGKILNWMASVSPCIEMFMTM